MASDIVPGKVLTSKSGTLAYLAPEVYAGQGYDVRADWWSLGVLFYECIYNKVRSAHVPMVACPRETMSGAAVWEWRRLHATANQAEQS